MSTLQQLDERGSTSLPRAEVEAAGARAETAAAVAGWGWEAAADSGSVVVEAAGWAAAEGWGWVAAD